MAKSSSSSENEVYDDSYCSKSCRKNTENLNTKISKLNEELSDCENNLYHYKIGLSQVEDRLVKFKTQEIKFCEKIRGLERDVEVRNNKIEYLMNELEQVKKEKEGLDNKLTGFESASKDLDTLLGSQRTDKNKEGLPEFVDDTINDYTLAQMESRLVEQKEREIKYIEKIRTLEYYDKGKKECIETLKKQLETLKLENNGDLSWTGLSECADDTNGESIDSILSKPSVKFVKAAERSTLNKVEAVKKPSVRYAELYRKPSKKSTVRGNQRNWNNLKSQQLGENFVRKNKACFNCGHFDLSYDCGLGVKKGTTRPQNNTHKSMPPRPSRPPMTPVRPNMNAARPKRTSFYKPSHSYNKRPFQDTTQELMIILIQRVQRLERELKARTPIHKVDRGRSRPVMAWVPKKKLDCNCSIKFREGLLGIKCSKPFPLSVMNSHCQKKFPLPEESSHC
nr:hypothetical protein [Tanacetum cinerariifolium]